MITNETIKTAINGLFKAENTKVVEEPEKKVKISLGKAKPSEYLSNLLKAKYRTKKRVGNKWVYVYDQPKTGQLSSGVKSISDADLVAEKGSKGFEKKVADYLEKMSVSEMTQKQNKFADYLRNASSSERKSNTGQMIQRSIEALSEARDRKKGSKAAGKMKVQQSREKIGFIEHLTKELKSGYANDSEKKSMLKRVVPRLQQEISNLKNIKHDSRVMDKLNSAIEYAKEGLKKHGIESKVLEFNKASNELHDLLKTTKERKEKEDKGMNKAENNLRNLLKAKKQVWVKPSGKKKGYYKTIEGAKEKEAGAPKEKKREHISKDYITQRGNKLSDPEVKKYNALQDKINTEKDPKKLEDLKGQSFSIIAQGGKPVKKADNILKSLLKTKDQKEYADHFDLMKATLPKAEVDFYKCMHSLARDYNLWPDDVKSLCYKFRDIRWSANAVNAMEEIERKVLLRSGRELTKDDATKIKTSLNTTAKNAVKSKEDNRVKAEVVKKQPTLIKAEVDDWRNRLAKADSTMIAHS